MILGNVGLVTMEPTTNGVTARTCPRHSHSFAEAFHIDDRFVVAEVADDPQRPHALRPHIAERHRRAAV
jgi:hypothetical protein